MMDRLDSLLSPSASCQSHAHATRVSKMACLEKEPATLTSGAVKTFIPLENNPDVFSHLASRLGLSRTDIVFHDVYSLDNPTLLDLVPRPVLALVLTCPAKAYHHARDKEASMMKEYNGSGDHPIMWFKQTIRESCGLMAFLHAVFNGQSKKLIRPGSFLDRLRKTAIPLTVDARARLLEESPFLESVYAEAARLGNTPTPEFEDDAGNHYITFVKADDGCLWELNGAMPGPVNRGPLAEDEDALSQTALSLGVRTFLKNARFDPRYSIVALSKVRVDDDESDDDGPFFSW
ncbi:hypothetical protein BDV97DRAFT_363068 [Delphinella strobiligena]|nr:hypothetical protein BDV97DRAFT_363068 [Delphinella strobiligena]